MPVVAIYSRKSKQTDKGESIQNQIDLCKEYALSYFSVDNFLIYEDEGFSGGHTDRPMFKKMIKDAKEKKFQIIVCYRLDRMSRNISDFAKTIEFLQSKNISFISIREQFDTSTPMGRAMMYIASVFAQLERETITERIRDNMYQLARTGRWLGGRTPLGFKSKQTVYYDKENNKRKMYILTPIKEEVEIIKLLFREYLKLQSLTKLEKWTIKKELKTRNNSTFDKSTLKIILSNPVYVVADNHTYEYFSNMNSEISNSKEDFDGLCGLMVFNKHNEKKNSVTLNNKSKWIVSVGKHEGIISSKEWIKVQNTLEKNKRKSSRTGTGKIGLITPLLICKNCGSKLRITVIKKKSRTYYYYKCLTKEKTKSGECNINNLNGPLADDYIVNSIKKLAYNKKYLLSYINNCTNFDKKLFTNPNKQKLFLEEELNSCEKAVESLVIQLSKYNSSRASDYIIKQIESLDLKIHEIKDKLLIYKHKNESSIELYKKNIDLILDLIVNFSENVNNLSFDEKKRIIDILVESIVWDGEVLRVSMLEVKKQ
ncbi:recombinase family protein [Brassicibacter mesophilus]|uniref:recombinase family protein n=1 Tax=Brassicibacter mesophilus TaxID=745119 RepID=UPI003D191459